MGRRQAIIKLILIVLSIITLVAGIASDNVYLSMVGSVIFVVYLSAVLCESVVAAKRFKLQNAAVAETTLRKWTERLAALVAIGGLALLGAGQLKQHDNFYSWSGLIIWFGNILFYFINGVVLRSIMKIPLRMGYGGWHVAHRRGTRSANRRSSYGRRTSNKP